MPNVAVSTTTMKRPLQCAGDSTMIRTYLNIPEHDPSMNSSSRTRPFAALTFPPPQRSLCGKMHHFALRISPKFSPMLRLTGEVTLTLQHHQKLRLPQKVTLFSTLLYSTLLFSTFLYSTLLFSAPLHSTLLFSTPLCSTLHFSSLLFCTPLYSSLLHSTPLYSSLRHSALLYTSLLYFSVLHSTLLCSTPLHSTLLYATLLYSTLLFSSLLFCTPLYSSLLHSTPLYSSLLYSTRHYSFPFSTLHLFNSVTRKFLHLNCL